jgi:hypothetical protein
MLTVSADSSASADKLLSCSNLDSLLLDLLLFLLLVLAVLGLLEPAAAMLLGLLLILLACFVLEADAAWSGYSTLNSCLIRLLSSSDRSSTGPCRTSMPRVSCSQWSAQHARFVGGHLWQVSTRLLHCENRM